MQQQAEPLAAGARWDVDAGEHLVLLCRTVQRVGEQTAVQQRPYHRDRLGIVDTRR
ncbi:hypothetical protein D3C86_1741340 [compost metagenome]